MTPTRTSSTCRRDESVLGALTLAVLYPVRFLAYELRSSCPVVRAAAIHFHGGGVVAEEPARRPAAV